MCFKYWEWINHCCCCFCSFTGIVQASCHNFAILSKPPLTKKQCNGFYFYLSPTKCLCPRLYIGINICEMRSFKNIYTPPRAPHPYPNRRYWNFLGMGGLLGSSISHCTVWGRECRPGSKKQFKSSLEVCKTKIFKEMYETLFGTCRGVEILKKIPSAGRGEVWILSGTTQCCWCLSYQHEVNNCS